MTDEDLEQVAGRWVLPATFAAVSLLSLMLMGVAILRGGWPVAVVHAVAALTLAGVALVCHRGGAGTIPHFAMPARLSLIAQRPRHRG